MIGSGGDGPHLASPAPLVRSLCRVTAVLRRTRGTLTADDLTPGFGPTCCAAVFLRSSCFSSQLGQNQAFLSFISDGFVETFPFFCIKCIVWKSARNLPSVSGWFKRIKSGWFSEHEACRRYVVGLKQEVCCRRLSPDSPCDRLVGNFSFVPSLGPSSVLPNNTLLRH